VTNHGRTIHIGYAAGRRGFWDRIKAQYMKTYLMALTVLLAQLGSEVYACSCSKQTPIASALREADLIVIAEAVSIEQRPRYADSTSTIVTEDAQFKIVEILKGARHPGEFLRIRSSIGAGACGVSTKNSPVWLETIEKGKSVGRPLSGRWLIYVMTAEGQDGTTIELSLCGRSSPMEVNGENEARRLRRLIASQNSDQRSSPLNVSSPDGQ
jgi:hypothetical protein